MDDPAAFAQALDAYLDSLTSEDLRNLVLRSIKRMDGAQRAQLALFLGFDVTAHPIDEVGGSGVADGKLRECIESCRLLRERFAGFLRENPRAISALGPAATQQILGENERRARRTIPLKAAGLAAIAFVIAFVPLAAQYAHQRGMLAGLQNAAMVPAAVAPAPAPVRAAAYHKVAAVPTHRPRVAVHEHKKVRHIAARPHARVAYHARPKHRAVAARPLRYSQDWKFSPSANPYVGGKRRRGVRAAVAADAFSGRAQMVVNSYLAAVIAGHTRSALQHLGLPPNAPPSNLKESAIVERGTTAHVVAVNPQHDGTARVEVDINGRTGEYFEVFYVARDGPAARITDRYYIPVNRTAEERAAHLLAKDGH